MTATALKKMKKTAEKEGYVLLPVATYQKLLEAREDELDARKLERLVRTNRGKKFIAWERVKTRHA